MTEERLTYTVKEAAEVLGCSAYLAYQAVREGRIPSLKFGKRILIPKYALQKLLEETSVGLRPTDGPQALQGNG